MTALIVLCLLSFSLAAVLCDPLSDQQDELQQVSDQVELTRGSCPMFWYEFRGRCYKYVGTQRSMGDAELNCLREGGNLASVHSLEEHNFMKTIINNFGPTHYTWIGLGDTYHEGGWMWTDGTKVEFTRWNNQEPDGGTGENCVFITGGSKNWCDWECYHKIPSICASRI